MANFGPSRAKTALSASPFWHYVCSGFSKIRSIFKNPFFFAKSRRATQKHKNEDGRGPRNKFWPCFEDPDFELRVAISRLETWRPIFPIAGHFCTPLQNADSNPIEPRRQCQRWKAKICFRVPRFKRGAPRRRRAPLAIIGPLLNPTRNCKDRGNSRVFWHRTLRAAILNACPGASSND